MKVDRFVLDSNVLIKAALSPTGNSRKFIDRIRLFNGVLLFSKETFSEISTRIMRSKFDKYVPREERTFYINKLVINYTEWVSINGIKLGCRDQDDDKFLETAWVGNADYIITYDKDLLDMCPFHNISIIKPEEFPDKFRAPRKKSGESIFPRDSKPIN